MIIARRIDNNLHKERNKIDNGSLIDIDSYIEIDG